MLTDNLLRPRPTRFTLLPSLLTLLPASGGQAKNPIMPNKPNSQSTMQTLTHVMKETYNEKNRLSTKKNKPKTTQKRTKNEQKRKKTNQNEPNSTPKTTPPKPFPNPISNFRAFGNFFILAVDTCFPYCICFSRSFFMITNELLSQPERLK